MKKPNTMRRAAALAALCCLLLTACGAGPAASGGYGAYVSVAGKAADLSVTLDIGAGEPEKRYPESTGATYYVASTGSSSNDGKSQESPLASIDDVNRLSLQPGDKVLFLGGDTFEGALRITDSGADDNPIYFGSYGQGRAVLTSSHANTVTLQKVSNVVVENLIIQVNGEKREESREVPGGCGIFIDCNINLNHDTEKDLRFRNLYILNNEILGNGFQTQTRGIEINSAFPWGVDGSAVPRGLLCNAWIEGNRIHDLGITGVSVLSWCSDYNQTGTVVDVYDNIHVDGNTIYSIGQMGAYLNACINSSIDRNLVYDTAINNDGITSVGDCGIMTLCCHDCTMNYNVVYGTQTAGTQVDGMGIDIDWNCDNIEVRFNHCYDNKGSGIGTMANTNCVISDNRIENNDLQSNQRGQLQVSDFTGVMSTLDASTYVVSNLIVENNLIINDLAAEYAVSVTHMNGGTPNWEGNCFQNNRVVNNFEADMPQYITVGADTPWYRFAGNMYFGSQTEAFSCLDMTDSFLIDSDAQALPQGYCNDFAAWAKRDVGATLSPLSSAAPSKVANVQATVADGKVQLTWEESKGDIFSYDIHIVAMDEEINHTNLYGRVYSGSHTLDLNTKGTYYVVIRPESTQGVYGEATKIELILQ